jgi:hypothetical protein
VVRKWLNNRYTIGIVAAGLFTAILLVVSVLSVVRPPEQHRRVFWFPDSTLSTYNMEWRFVPYRSTRSAMVDLYVRELVLGPARMNSVPILPRETTIRSVVLGESGRVFVDFSPEGLLGDTRERLALDDLLELLEKNLLHNFSFVPEVVVTIGGREPNIVRFELSPLTKDRGAL